MLNRELKVDFVKKGKTEATEVNQPGPTFEEKAIVISRLVQKMVTKVGVSVILYVIVDTIRKSTIEVMKQP